MGSPYLHFREQSTHILLSKTKGPGTPRERWDPSAQQYSGVHFTAARTPPRGLQSVQGSTFGGPIAPPPAALGGAATARRGALPRPRFPPPSLGSRKTRSEPALPGGACSVASRFSSLVGSSSATLASAAAAAAPQGSQIPRPRPRAFPLPCWTLRPAPPRPGSLAFWGSPLRGAGAAAGASLHPPSPSRRLRRGARPGPGAQPRRAGGGGGSGRGQPRAAPAGRGGVGGLAPGRWGGMPPPPPPGCVRSPRLVPVSGGWPGAGLAPQAPLRG